MGECDSGPGAYTRHAAPSSGASRQSLTTTSKPVASACICDPHAHVSNTHLCAMASSRSDTCSQAYSISTSSPPSLSDEATPHIKLEWESNLEPERALSSAASHGDAVCDMAGSFQAEDCSLGAQTHALHHRSGPHHTSAATSFSEQLRRARSLFLSHMTWHSSVYNAPPDVPFCVPER